MTQRTILLLCDELDYDTIQNELAKRQACRWPDGSGPIVPDGDSNLQGVMIAESIRDLDEYRSMFNARNPK